MNKFFLNFLFCFTIISASESDCFGLLIKPTSCSQVAKQLVFWVPTAVAFETWGYFFDKVKPYQYNKSKTKTWPQYFKKKISNTSKSCFNGGLFFGQTLVVYLGNQFVVNMVSIFSLQKPKTIELDKMNLLMGYIFKSEVPSPYQKVNELLASTANSFNMQVFLKNGVPPLADIPRMIPASAKIVVANFFLKNRISLLKRIDVSFLRGLFLSFELTEYIVKGWSGQHHVNDRMMISLHWLLLTVWVGGCWYFDKKREIFASLQPRQLPISYARTTSNLEEVKESIIETLNDDTRLRQNKRYVIRSLEDDTVKNDLSNKFEGYKGQYKTELKSRQKTLFFYNIIALMSGICFHALLNTVFYWYKQYRKV